MSYQLQNVVLGLVLCVVSCVSQGERTITPSTISGSVRYDPYTLGADSYLTFSVIPHGGNVFSGWGMHFDTDGGWDFEECNDVKERGDICVCFRRWEHEYNFNIDTCKIYEDGKASTFRIRAIFPKYPMAAPKFNIHGDYLSGEIVGPPIYADGTITQNGIATADTTAKGADALWSFTLRSEANIPAYTFMYIEDSGSVNFDYSKCDTKSEGFNGCMKLQGEGQH
eukprot:Platyproteum_vivax@DN11032_c0_g1_i1.p1